MPFQICLNLIDSDSPTGDPATGALQKQTRHVGHGFTKHRVRNEVKTVKTYLSNKAGYQ